MSKLVKFLILGCVAVALGACNTNEPVPYDDDGDHDGDHSGNHDGNTDGDGGSGSTSGDDGTIDIDCGPISDGFYVAVMSNLTGRQEVVVLKAGTDDENVVQLTANVPRCVAVHEQDEPTVIAIVLKCDAGQPCPDYERETPVLTIRTIPEEEIYFYFGWEGGRNLHELPTNMQMFETAYGVGPLYHDWDWLIYTSDIMDP